VTEPTTPHSSAFEIKLPMFEGPLDLLLHLIRKHELNVLDLPIAFVTERYLEYLKMMQELDLDEASEYLVMAATLAHIKSKMLLPQSPIAEAAEEQDDGYQEDPRAELIRRLLEYQKYKAAAEHLGSRPIAGRDVFLRGMPAPAAQGPAPLASLDMFKLLDAFGAILKRVQGRSALEVQAERITIHERMTQLTDLLREVRSCTFDDLFETDRTRYEVVVTFLALLEMTKLRMTRIYQTDPSSPLHVHFALLDEEQAATTATEYATTADSPGLSYASAELDELDADAEDAQDFSEDQADDFDESMQDPESDLDATPPLHDEDDSHTTEDEWSDAEQDDGDPVAKPEEWKP
jgi:segregation and condensation protein A